MSELPEQTQKLIRLLTGQTERGSREWEKGSSDTEFVFLHNAGSVTISSVDGDGAPPFEIRIFDTAGSIVERYTTSDPGSEALPYLYEAARKSSVKPSVVVETLLSQLQDSDVPF